MTAAVAAAKNNKILVPIFMLITGQADMPSTIISLVSGLGAFGLGLFAVKQVKHIYHSEGG